MKKSPLAEVKDRFGDKSKLVDAVRKLATDELWLDEVNDDKGLDCVSNRKLLHLHDVLSGLKEQLGSRDKLIDAMLELEKRKGDEGYRARLESKPTPRLWDQYTALKRRAERQQAKAS